MFPFLIRGVTPAVQLTRKLISALEAIEKLPVYTYDIPGSGYGLQVKNMCVVITGYSTMLSNQLTKSHRLEVLVVTIQRWQISEKN